MADVTIHLGERTYPIHIGAGAVEALRGTLAQRLGNGGRVAIITDTSVWAAVKPWRDEVFPDGTALVTLPPGERTKSWPFLSQVHDFLAESGMDRGGLVVALGGGVIGDLAGFAAASFLRGIDFVQVPTTLLALVDSSVGGKTGINIKAGKNLVGAFHQPIGVYSEIGWLGTLPQREFNAGMAEVLKYGMLAERALFEELEAAPLRSFDDPRLERVVIRCCEIKRDVVEADERETAGSGGRMLLNLGHTFGHAIEAAGKYTTFLHGEAVGIGLVLAARLSRELGLIESSDVDRVVAVVAGHGLPTTIPSRFTVEELLATMMRDKKWKGLMTRFVVMDAIGQASVREDVRLDLVSRLLREGGATSVGVVV